MTQKLQVSPRCTVYELDMMHYVPVGSSIGLGLGLMGPAM